MSRPEEPSEPQNPAYRTPPLHYWPEILLWWQSHLSESDRAALIAIAGLPVAQFSHSRAGQLMALRYILGLPPGHGSTSALVLPPGAE